MYTSGMVRIDASTSSPELCRASLGYRAQAFCLASVGDQVGLFGPGDAQKILEWAGKGCWWIEKNAGKAQSKVLAY